MTHARTARVRHGSGLLLLALSLPAVAQNPPESPAPPSPVIPGSDVETVPSPPPAGEANRGIGETPGAGAAFAERGGGGLFNFMSPVVGRVVPHADYRAAWFPQEQVQNQAAKLGYLQQDFALTVPIFQDSPDEWSASAKIRAESFHTGAILPDTHDPFPSELWNVHLGTSYRHLFDNGWIGGGSVTVGSASDKPFHGINEITVGATAFLRVPQGDHNAWLFSLNYSTNSEVLNGIPIPGVAYFYAPSESFQATIGFPFASLVYRPDEDWILQLSYALLTTVHAKATFVGLRPLRLYAGFDWANESYFRVGRVNDRDRFFYCHLRGQ